MKEDSHLKNKRKKKKIKKRVNSEQIKMIKKQLYLYNIYLIKIKSPMML